jgi:hypothetical protein
MLIFSPNPSSEVASKELPKKVKGSDGLAKLDQSTRSLPLSAVRLVINDRARLGDGKAISRAVRATPVVVDKSLLKKVSDHIFIT